MFPQDRIENWAHGQGLWARVPAEEEIRGESIVEALVRGGFAVRDFHEKRPTLEDIFIAATKRSYDVKE